MKDGKMQSKGGEINGEGEEAREREEREKEGYITKYRSYCSKY